MTEKGYNKVAVSPNKELYIELHNKGWGCRRLWGKSIELDDEIQPMTFWRFFKNPHNYTPSTEEKPKKDNWPRVLMDSFDTM